MKQCWSIIMDEFPWIMVLPCQAHVLSLLMKDIGKSKKVLACMPYASLPYYAPLLRPLL